MNQPPSPVLLLIDPIRGFLRAALNRRGQLSPPGVLGSAPHTKQPERLWEIGPKKPDVGFAHPQELFEQCIPAFLQTERAAASHRALLRRKVVSSHLKSFITCSKGGLKVETSERPSRS